MSKESKSTDDIKQPMIPLWLKYPFIRRYSIGWRMGYGEDYACKFYTWFNKLDKDEKRLYIDMYPEPVEWTGWYEDVNPDNLYEDSILAWDKIKHLQYSNDYIRNTFNKEDLEFIFFWGHQPSNKGIITKSCFSQWWESTFKVSIDEYAYMEQYMMAQKARLFKDNDALSAIMKCNNPQKIKTLGRQVKNFDEAKWNEKKYQIVLQGNYYKFSQDPKLREFILSTGDKVLVEASPYDQIWGIGMSADDDDIKNPYRWKGTNLLGYALMEVRDEIKKVYKNYA